MAGFSYVKVFKPLSQFRHYSGKLTEGEWPVKAGEKVVIPAGTVCFVDKEPNFVMPRPTTVTLTHCLNGYTGDDILPKTNPKVYWRGASCDLNDVARLLDFETYRSDGEGKPIPGSKPVVAPVRVHKKATQASKDQPVSQSKFNPHKEPPDDAFGSVPEGEQFKVDEVLTRCGRYGVTSTGLKVRLPLNAKVAKVAKVADASAKPMITEYA